MSNIIHNWNSEFCSCGTDSVTCQVCGQRKCGSLMNWKVPVPGKTFNGNVCAQCSGFNASPLSTLETLVKNQNEKAQVFHQIEKLALLTERYNALVTLSEEAALIKTVLESALTFPQDDIHPLVRRKIIYCVTHLTKALKPL